MKLAQLIPIENCIINGYSLVDNVFGSGIVILDELGVMHTTAKNVKLIARAQTLIEDLYNLDPQSLSCALATLREAADTLDQADYDRTVLREARCAEAAADTLSLAGCLE